MNDLITSVKAQLYDRVSSPLLSSFLVSWTVWNHRLFLVASTSDLKIKERFDFIDNVLYPTWHEVLGRGFTFPLISALFLLFVYPIPGRMVYGYVRNEQKRLKEIQQKIDDETPITQEQARELRAAVRKLDADYQKEIDSRDELISRLKSDLSQSIVPPPVAPTSSSSAKRSSVREQYEDVELPEQQYELLRIIANNVDGVSQAGIRASNAQHLLAGEHAIDELVRHGFIKKISFDDDSLGYEATARGRAYVITQERNLFGSLANSHS